MFGYLMLQANRHLAPKLFTGSLQTTKRSQLTAIVSTIDNRRFMNSYILSHKSVASKLEESLQKNNRVARKSVYNFLHEIRNSDQPPSRNHSLIMIRVCGSCFAGLSTVERNALADEVFSLLINKKAVLDISHFNALLQVYLENGTNFDPAKFLELLANYDQKPNRVTYQRLLHRYCVLGDMDGAADILNSMKSEDMSINVTVFNSLILGYGNAKDLQSAKSVLQLISDSNLLPDKDTYKMLVCAHISNMDNGVTEQGLRNLLSDIAKEDIFWTFSDFFEIITRIAKFDAETPLIDEIIRGIPKVSGYSLECQNAVIHCIYEHKINLAMKLFKTIQHSKVSYDNKMAGMFLIDHLVKARLPHEKVFEVCESMVKSNLNIYAYQKAAESALEYLPKAEARIYLDKFMNHSGKFKIHFFWPLLCKCETDDEIFELLRNDIFGKFEENLEETFSVYVWPRVKSKFPFFQKLLKAGFSESMLINSMFAFEGPREKELGKIPPLQRQQQISELLQELANSSKDPDQVKDMYNLLCSVTKVPVSESLIRPIILSYIKAGNMKQASEIFLTCLKKYGIAPCMKELMEACIENSDSHFLQKIVNACTPVYGESSVLTELALSFIACKRDSHARKVFDTPGFRIFDHHLTRTCRSLIQEKKYEILEKFVDLTKNVFNINRDEQYYYLISAYSELNQPEKALEAWTSMQEESNFTPSQRTLRIIAKLLSDNNMPVPFQLDLDAESQVEDRKSAREKVMALLKSGQVGKALEFRNQLTDSTLSMSDECRLLEALVNNNDLDGAFNVLYSLVRIGRFPIPQVIRQVIKSLAEDGRARNIESMMSHLPVALLSSNWFSDLLLIAHLRSGADNKYLVEAIVERRQISTNALLLLLHERPSVLPLLKDAGISKYQETNDIQLLNAVWIYLMETHQFAEAKSLIEISEKMRDFLFFSPLREVIRQKNDLELADELLENLYQVRIQPRTLASLYSTIMNTLMDRNKFVQAQDYLLRAIGTEDSKKSLILSIGDFSESTIYKLYNGLLTDGISPKFSIEDRTQRNDSKGIPESATEEGDGNTELTMASSGSLKAN